MPMPEQIAALGRDLWGLELAPADAGRLAAELERLAGRAATADFDVEPGGDFSRRLIQAGQRR
jgi:hypothetical protein